MRPQSDLDASIRFVVIDVAKDNQPEIACVEVLLGAGPYC